MSESETTGTEWLVERIVRVVDGDTLRVLRGRRIELDGRHYQLTDDELDGIPIRLTWVDTPERGQQGYTQAKSDLAYWLTEAMGIGRLRVVCYESAGWDRLLGDFLDAGGNSASQWLMVERGWLPYVAGK